MTPVETDYRFVGPDGEVGLLDLFAGRRQLVVYRFFYEPDVDGWPDRDTTFVMVSPADQDKITTLKQRMGWDMPWYTLLGDAFSNDFGVAEMFGLNVFLRDDGNRVFRTYFVNGRGVEPLTPTWSILDITPLGRQEEWEDTPGGRPQTPPYWFGRHHEYP